MWTVQVAGLLVNSKAHRFHEREGMTTTGFHFAENITG